MVESYISPLFTSATYLSQVTYFVIFALLWPALKTTMRTHFPLHCKLVLKLIGQHCFNTDATAFERQHSQKLQL